LVSGATGVTPPVAFLGPPFAKTSGPSFQGAYRTECRNIKSIVPRNFKLPSRFVVAVHLCFLFGINFDISQIFDVKTVAQMPRNIAEITQRDFLMQDRGYSARREQAMADFKAQWLALVCHITGNK
jgi:hypothetical protein